MKRYEVLFYENGKLSCGGYFDDYQEFQRFINEYPLAKNITYKVFDRYPELYSKWPKDRAAG